MQVSEPNELVRLNRMYQTLKQERDKSWLTNWKDIRRYISPDDGQFEGDIPDDSKRVDSKIINPAPRRALNTLRAGMMSGMTSPSSQWFKLTTNSFKAEAAGPVANWLYGVQQAILTTMAQSNLYNVLPMIYGSCAAYGTAVMTVMPDQKEVVRCTAIPVGTYMINTNNQGQVDTMYREIPMTAKMMIDQFGDRVSQTIKLQAESGGLQWNKVYEAIEPNPNYDATKLDQASMAYQCTYWDNTDGTKWLSRRGFKTFPAMAPRWDVNGNNIYGTGPGWVAIGKCKELQVLESDKLRMIRTGANPSMTAPVSLRGQRATTVPGEITWLPDNLVGVKFEPSYVPDRAWLGEIRNEINECEQTIAAAFFADLFLMISSIENNMTAYEVSVRKEEKMLMLGPVLERMNDELLDPLVERYFEIMLNQSQPIWEGLMDGVPLLPMPPEELADQELTIEYISLLAQAQKMTGVANIERAVGFTMNTMQAIPSAADLLNIDAATTELFAALGVPPTMIRGTEEVEAIRTAQAEAQAAQMEMAMATAQANNVKTLSQAPTDTDNALTAMTGKTA